MDEPKPVFIGEVAIGWVAAQVGDPVIVTASFSMLGALLGFILWNYPRSRIASRRVQHVRFMEIMREGAMVCYCRNAVKHDWTLKRGQAVSSR